MMKRLRSAGALLLVVSAGCERVTVSSPRPQPPPRPSTAAKAPAVTASSDALAAMEAKIVEQINARRREHGLQPLQRNEALDNVARAYSRRMTGEDFFEHTSPSGDTAVDRVRAAGIRFTMLAENLFKSVNAPDPARLAVEGWMKSPGHRKNILQPRFTQTGVGIWREGRTLYITQLFRRP